MPELTRRTGGGDHMDCPVTVLNQYGMSRLTECNFLQLRSSSWAILKEIAQKPVVLCCDEMLQHQGDVILVGV